MLFCLDSLSGVLGFMLERAQGRRLETAVLYCTCNETRRLGYFWRFIATTAALINYIDAFFVQRPFRAGTERDIRGVLCTNTRALLRWLVGLIDR